MGIDTVKEARANEAMRSLDNAVMAVVDVAREIADEAIRQRDGSWSINADMMQSLRGIIGGWERASGQLIAAQRGE